MSANTTPSTSVLERLRHLHRLLRRCGAGHHGPRGPLADVTRGRGRVLAALQMQSPIPTRELAYLLDIRQQSLNELVKKLEADGLVERTPSETDRRVMMVSLTEAGRQTRVGGKEPEAFAVLSEEEHATLCSLLDKLIDSLESERGLDAEAESAWQAETRRRIGDDGFEAIMTLREAGFGNGPRRGRRPGRPGGTPGRGGHGHDGHGHDGHGHGGHDRGPCEDGESSDFGSRHFMKAGFRGGRRRSGRDGSRWA